MDDNHYRTLNVQPEATADEIQRAYRALARRFHPDLNSMPGAVMRMTSINMAYEVLSEPDKRAAYDQKRKPRDGGVEEAILRAARETLARQGWTISGESAREFILKSGSRTVHILLVATLDSDILRTCLLRSRGFFTVLAVRVEPSLRIPASVVIIDLLHSRLYAGAFPDPAYSDLFKKFLSS